MTNEIPKVKRTFYTIVAKRLLDIVLSGIALVILSPLFLIISLLELIYHGSPVFYAQERPGLHGKIFKLHFPRSYSRGRA